MLNTMWPGRVRGTQSRGARSPYIRLFLLHADRVLALGLIVAGVVLLILGYHGASHSMFPAGQIPYVLSDGIGGLFCLGFGATLLISADLRDEWTKLDRVEAEMRALREQLAEGNSQRPANVDRDRARSGSLVQS